MTTIIRISTCILTLLLSSSLVYSQQESSTLSGTVTDHKNTSIEGVTIILKKTNYGAYTNEYGMFKITELKPSSYTLTISSIGFKTQTKQITISKNQDLIVNISLEEDITSINEILIKAKTESLTIREQGYNVNAINTKQIKNNTTDASVILNKTSGVRIRSAGGLGSRSQLSLNGLTGKQIRIFVDDIPIDELGEAYSLNNISVNLIERIDVYKGVVPIKLGADALGGAINIITDKKKGSYFDVSHSFGSFNTHRFNLSSQYKSKKGFTLKLSSAYNYSDNNYTMYNVDYFIEENGIQREVTRNIKRFHDQYRSINGNIGAGFTNTTWADVFLIDFNTAQINKEIQGLNNRAIGEATEEEKNQTIRLKYTKSGLLNHKLKLDLFTLYNTINSTRIDTSSNRYQWDGSFKRNEIQDNRGEFLTDKTRFEFKQTQFQYRVNANYKITNNHSISINHIYSNINRAGENRMDTEENQPFKSPNILKKTVTGLEYTSTLFNNKLENIVATKLYHFDMLAKASITFSDASVSIEDITTLQNEMGYLVSSRYFLNPDFFIKASFEKGYRIPQPKEIFGDGLSVLATPTLQPETSKNLNFGISYTRHTGNGSLKNEVNVFQRDVKNFIRLKFLGLINAYQNEPDVLIQGLEWTVSYTKNKLKLKGNLTWQNVLNNQNFPTGSFEEEAYEKQQLPNTPSLFANASANYKLPAFINKVNTAVYYGANFVNTFYLTYKKVARLNDKNKIPTQFINNIGVTCSTKNKKHNLNFEVQNLFNALAFDNFKQQKPGRAFYIKYRFYLDH